MVKSMRLRSAGNVVRMGKLETQIKFGWENPVENERFVGGRDEKTLS
jgi:hypothetical protein